MERLLLKKLPNYLTFGRIILIPILCGLLLAGHRGLGVFSLFVVMAISDYFDGYFARKYKVESDLGRCFDPISDKIFVLGIFVCLISTQFLGGTHIWAVLIILFREIFVSGLREFLGPKNITLPVSKLAKWKTGLQMMALGLLMLGYNFLGNHFLGNAVMIFAILGVFILWLAALITLITGYQYLRGALPYFKSAS